MHVCGQCSSPLEPSAQFCGHCGAPLTGSQAPTMAGTDASDLPVDPLIGREVIGQYVIVRKIGAGGMGAVYLADQPSMGRQAVIKVLHPWLSKDPGVAARFENEARAVAQLSDPHIVQIFNYGAMTDGTLFFAMEHLDGRTLTQVLAAEGSLPVERTVDLTLQICAALRESHRQGIVHRDLKPSNIMLLARPGGEFVKLLDFGVAKLRDTHQTTTGQPVGTPRYMSPEQLAAAPVDGRSDLYSLGLVAYEMLVGVPPFESDTPVGYVHKHISEAPPPLAGRVPRGAVPEALNQTIMRVLSKSPDDRPADALAFADALRAAMLPGATVQPVQPVAPQAAFEDEDEEGRGRAVLAGLAALVVVGSLAGGAYWIWGRGGNEAELAGQSSSAETETEAETQGSSESSGASAPDQSETASDDESTSTGLEIAAPPDLPALALPETTRQTTPLPPLSKEAEALLVSSVAELEKEFYALLDGTYVPPSAKQQIRDGYGTMARALTPGPQAEMQRKTYLVQVILGYRNTPRTPPGFDLPIAKLESILRGLEGPITADIRMQTYRDMVKGFNDTPRSPEDQEYWRRYALVSLIGTFSGDENYLEGKLK